MRLVGVLAVLVLLIHLLWILWVILGWLVTRNRRLLAWLHIGSLLWGILMEVGPWPCPLTIAKQWLQRRAGSTAYEGSFLIHYLEAVIYPDVSQELLTWVGSGVCFVILGIHGRRFWQERVCTDEVNREYERVSTDLMRKQEAYRQATENLRELGSRRD